MSKLELTWSEKRGTGLSPKGHMDVERAHLIIGNVDAERAQLRSLSTCAHSHNLLKIHVKIYIFIETHRNFLRAGECFYVMENGPKIKIVKLI